MSRSAILCLLPGVIAMGQTQWIDPNGGDFDDGANWSPAGVPATDAEVNFDIGDASYEVFFPSFQTDIGLGGGGTTITLPLLVELDAMSVGDDQVTFDGSAGSSITLTRAPSFSSNPFSLSVGLDSGDNGLLSLDTMRMATETTAIGHSGNGRMFVRHGSSFSGDEVFIGVNDSGDGHLLVRDADSTATFGKLVVGYDGAGSHHTLYGGDVTVTSEFIAGQLVDSTGKLEVQDSTWRTTGTAVIGGAGEARMYVHGVDSRVDFGDALNEGLYLGNSASGEGELDVRGATNEVDVSGSVFVGYRGQGLLELSDGAVGSSNYLGVAMQSGSYGEVHLSGEGTRWHSRSNIVNPIGSGGEAVVFVEDGATLETGVSFVGGADSSRGDVTVGGNGAVWSMNHLYVGSSNGGQGTVNVHTGGTVTVEDMLEVTSNGTLKLTGGRVEAGGFDLKGDGFNFALGTVGLAGDATLSQSMIDGLLSRTYGSLREGQHLSVAGRAILEGELRLRGGKLTVGSLANAQLLTFDTGTLRLTGQEGLIVGYGGTFGPALNLGDPSGLYEPGDTQQVQVTGGSAQIADEGVVTLQSGSSFGGGLIENNGQIELRGAGARVTGDPDTANGVLDNYGLVRGAGQIDAALHNQATGLVQVTAQQQISGMYNDSLSITTIPGRMVFTAATNENHGQLYVDGGNELAFLGELQNGQTGAVHVGGDAMATFQGGLTNEGVLTVSQGSARILGTITNRAGGEIQVADDSRGRFFGNIVNNGEVAVDDGSTAVFLGEVSGSGAFTGGGTIAFAGELAPGNSPGVMTFDGDVDLSELDRLVMEIAGYAPGTEHDLLDVAGQLTLGGEMELRLLDGFMPQRGDVFQLLKAGELVGGFSALNLAPLDGGLSWDTSALSTSGAVSVVPEPATVLAMAFGLGGMITRRRRIG